MRATHTGELGRKRRRTDAGNATREETQAYGVGVGGRLPLAELEEELRRAGLPPGWGRE